MSTPGQELLHDDLLVAEFAAAAAKKGIAGYLPDRRELLHPGLVEKLAGMANQKVRVNAQASLALAETALRSISIAPKPRKMPIAKVAAETPQISQVSCVPSSRIWRCSGVSGCTDSASSA